MFGSAVKALRCSCCMASATREICGYLSPKHWSKTTLSSFLISVAWACRLIPKAVTKRPPRLGTWLQSSMS
jgi:hypothetical protein